MKFKEFQILIGQFFSDFDFNIQALLEECDFFIFLENY